jgi:hypothetical protein
MQVASTSEIKQDIFGLPKLKELFEAIKKTFIANTEDEIVLVTVN